ncbi:hypothetical protein [Streptomyces sp. NPDC004296]|uniref:hypothetical protein n=1 Tax=Streptomyces sp. NPDC004296 TaxID=3364697 RepID=UPI0036A791AA
MGRKPRDRRQVFDGIWWRARAGSPAGVGDGQSRVVHRHHAGPQRTGRGSAVLRHVFRLVV